MEFTKIPNLSIESSLIGLGTWAIGGWLWGGTDEHASIATLHRAFELGINLVDTAPVYGFGVAEKIVGKTLKAYGKREEIIISTKTGLSWAEEGGDLSRNSQRENIIKEVEESLSRMMLDYIDIYFIHWPDSNTPFEETAEAMRTLLKSGKIRAIGVSNYDLGMIQAFEKVTPIQAYQPPFNLYERDIEGIELAYCREKGIATFGYGTLCRGLLSGKMDATRKFKGDDIRQTDPKFQPPLFENYLKCNQKLAEWAQSNYQKTLLALAVRWALDKGVNVALWGARRPEQLTSIEKIFNWKLTDKDFYEIDAIIDQSVSHPGGV